MEATVSLPNGKTTLVEAWGDGPTILCVHGITSSRKSWDRFGRHFARRFRTVAYDQAGHGDAAASHGPMTHEAMVADACAVAGSLDAPVAAVVGHSWGGAVAILAAPRIASVNAVVAVDPMIYVPPGTWSADYLDDTVADLALDAAARERTFRERCIGWDESDIAGKLHAMASMKADAVARLGADTKADAGGWDLRGILASYPKPLLVAAAAPADSVMSNYDLALLRRAHVTVVEFPGHGHNLHRTGFTAFVKAVEEFFEGRVA